MQFRCDRQTLRMFNVGTPEMLVILLVALIVLGPDKLPAAARKVGQVAGELRRLSSGFQDDLRGAMQEPFTDAATHRESAGAGPTSRTTVDDAALVPEGSRRADGAPPPATPGAEPAAEGVERQLR